MYIAALIVLALLALYLVGLPILATRLVAFSADPPLEDVDADDARIPEAVRVFHEDVRAQLEPLGFVPTSRAIDFGSVAGVTGYTALFHRPRTSDQAGAVAIYIRAGETGFVQQYAVEFTTDFVDGHELNTSSVCMPYSMAPVPWKHNHRIPALADLELLVRVHEGLAARRGAAKAPLPNPKEGARCLREGILKDYRDNCEAGWMRLDSEGQVYRLTMKGALLSVSPQLPGIGRITRALLKRRARRLLRELGLPVNYTQVDYSKRYQHLRTTVDAPVEPDIPDGAAPDDSPSSVDATSDASAPTDTASCSSCGQPVVETYYLEGGARLCESCGRHAQAARQAGSKFRRVFGATVLGGVAAVLAAVVYFGVAAVTGYEVGWIALFSGALVGGGVWLGSGRRGGRGYQLLALFLTYYAFGLSYGLFVVQEYIRDPSQFEEALEAPVQVGEGVESEASPEPVAEDQASGEPDTGDIADNVAGTEPGEVEDVTFGGALLALLLAFCLLSVIALFLPIVVAISSGTTAVFLFIALYGAWQITKRREPQLTGPHEVPHRPSR